MYFELRFKVEWKAWSQMEKRYGQSTLQITERFILRFIIRADTHNL